MRNYNFVIGVDSLVSVLLSYKYHDITSVFLIINHCKDHMRYQEFIQDLPAALLEAAYIRQQDRKVIDQLGEMFSIGIEYEFFVDDDRILDFIYRHKINYDPGNPPFSRGNLPRIVFDLIKKSRSAWGIDPSDISDVDLDGSIGHGVEVITQPLSFPDALVMYKKMCGVIRAIGSTSEKTGMHVNISIKNQDMTKINHTKLLMLLDPDLQQNIFPLRKWVDDVFSALLANSSKIIDEMMSGRDYIKTFERYINKSEKHQQINFNHLHEQDDLARLELRYFGGEGYETRTNTVINGLYAAARAVGAAYDPEYLENKYRSRLAKFIDVLFQQRQRFLTQSSIVKFNRVSKISDAQEKRIESAESFVEYKNAIESTISSIYKKASTPVELVDTAIILGHRLPAEYENKVAQDAEPAFRYAKSVLRRPFVPGEPAIARDAQVAFQYAYEVLKPAGVPRNRPGRFELGEPAIAQDAQLAYKYADYILRGRFEQGEPAIAQDSRWALQYAFDILRGPFEAGEPAIAQNFSSAFWYAMEVLKPARVPKKHPGRFERGEPAIAQKPQLAYKYAKEVLRGPFEVGEPAIAQDARLAYEYARDVLVPAGVPEDRPGRFERGESAIAQDGRWAFPYARDILKDPDPGTWAQRYLEQQGKNQ